MKMMPENSISELELGLLSGKRDIIKSCGFKDGKGAYPPLKY